MSITENQMDAIALGMHDCLRQYVQYGHQWSAVRDVAEHLREELEGSLNFNGVRFMDLVLNGQEG